jgi:hypothetical protein
MSRGPAKKVKKRGDSADLQTFICNRLYSTSIRKMPVHLPSSRHHSRALTIWTICCLLVIPVFYWSYTGQVWEDFLITYRHSENFVAGNGLTYQAGTRVHGFTSPLNVLVPTFFAVLTQARTFALPLFLTNIVTLSCLVGGGLILLRTLLLFTTAQRRWALWLLPLFLALNVKVSAYTVNGQEAGYWVLFLAVSFSALVKGFSQHWLQAGIGWAGLMWTRPDSPVHIILLAMTAVALPVERRQNEIKGVVKAAAICTVLYLPWFIGAWLYYGSPIPHTILAKSGAYNMGWSTLSREEAFLKLLRWLGEPFLPIYSYAGGWPIILLVAAAAVGLVGVICIASRDRITRLAACGFAGSAAYLIFVAFKAMPFPWYFIPPAVFGAVLATRWLACANLGHPYRTLALGSCSAILLLTLAYSFTGSLRQMEAQQRIVENGVRRSAGLWLGQHVKPGERVFLEPIGYIGYFSQAHLLDYPGLVSPEVVAARHRYNIGFYGLIDHFHPEWLVLRPHEYSHFGDQCASAADYHIAIMFDANDELKSIGTLPGLGYLYTDSVFFVLKRNQ